MINVGASSRSLQVRGVLLFGGRKIQTMVVRIVEEVALDPPYFVVHLIPLHARIDVYLHRVEMKSAVARLGHDGRRRNEPRRAGARPLTIKRLLAVCGDDKGAHTPEERLRFASAQLKLGD